MVEVGDMVIIKPKGVVAFEVVETYTNRKGIEYAKIEVGGARLGVPVSQLRIVKKG